MVVSDQRAVRPVAESVSVAVDGGQETSSMGKSQISSDDFSAAITQSILDNGVFSQVLPGNEGQYRLNAVIVTLEQPTIGFSFTVNMEAAWRLIERASGKVVWEQVINSTATATTGDAFAAVTRLRLATEGAAKANIEQAVITMGGLAL